MAKAKAKQKNETKLGFSPLTEDEDRLNRNFLDLQIRRVELLIEVTILQRLVRDGKLRYDECQDRSDPFLQTVREVEEQLLELVARREAGMARFPIIDLMDTYGLSPKEREIFVFCLAPRLDLSVRKLYARFHDNVLLDFPDIQFLTYLVAGHRQGAMAARRLLDPEAPLLANKLVELHQPQDLAFDSYLGWEVRPPARLVDLVLGHFGLERSLRPYCTLEEPETRLSDVVLPEQSVTEMLTIVDRYPEFREKQAKRSKDDKAELGGALVIQFSGPSGTGKSLFTRAIAHRMKKPLLRVHCAKLNLQASSLERVLDNIFYEAALHDAILCFDAVEGVLGTGNPRLTLFYDRFEVHQGLVILNATNPKKLDATLERWVVYQLNFERPEAGLREKIWKLHIPSGTNMSKEVQIDILAAQFDLTGFQIRNALVVATNRALAKNPKKPVLTKEVLEGAAYAQLRANLEDYSVRSRTNLTMDDLVLPEKENVLINEILNAARVRPFVMNRWGFGKRLSTGKGIICLFTGEPGTGKTLCAEILANELNLSLYQVSIPRVMSKYIGETEKNMEKIFATARANNSMLLFDEADALFTSRVKVDSSVDRFSNMEVNNLLQEIERFEGVVILTTNLDKNIDKAFQRRINFRINFPFPDEPSRSRIWEKLIPQECPLDDDIDYGILGEHFELSGGYIKNAVVRAAYRAYGEDRSINYDDLIFAAEQECVASGRVFWRPDEDEL
jgi:SpoVK/Ycf46/Vps4 family AAA+-type ATPase